MAAVEQNDTGQKGMARKTQAQTRKQQAETPSAFKSPCPLPAKLYAELFDKDFIWFRSDLEAESLASDQSLC